MAINLKNRIERLEGVTFAEPLVIVRRSFAGARELDDGATVYGELTGYRAGDTTIERKAGEEEAALRARAAEAARRPFGVTVLREVRTDGPGDYT